ncbi:hypothetical protein CU044_7499 [Streptomyces sp. L-9-10]|nr:hypothetical protein CU044_7499 [Streptomyces sp. L-9-10]
MGLDSGGQQSRTSQSLERSKNPNDDFSSLTMAFERSNQLVVSHKPFRRPSCPAPPTRLRPRPVQ